MASRRLVHRRYLSSGGSTPPPDPTPPGATAPLKMIQLGGGTWDTHLAAPGAQAAFEAQLEMIVGFRGTPQWNLHKGWALMSMAYLNTFSDTNASYSVFQNDSDGAALYLPFAVQADGTYERRSQDLKSTTYRTGFVNAIKAVMADGGEGMMFDDANLAHGRMFKRAGGGAPLIANDLDGASFYENTTTGLVGWAALLGDFYHDVTAQVRLTYPNAKFIINPVRWDLGPERWTDPRWARLVDAADYVIMEHGYADPGLTAGAGSDIGVDFALRSTHKWVDFIHSRGKGFIPYARGDGAIPADTRRYEVANYLAKYNPALDMIGVRNESAAWPTLDSVFDTDLGARLTVTDSNVANSTISATFANGSLSFTPVGRASAVITVGGGGGGGGGTAYATEVAADSPLAYWELDQTTSTFTDTSTGTRPLTADASVGTLTRGVAGLKSGGLAARFQNGARGWYVHDVALRLIGDFSIEFWVNATLPGSGFPSIIRKGTGNAVGSWQCYMIGADGNIAFKRDSIDRNLNPVQLSAGVTSHVVITYNAAAAQLKGYENGALVQTLSAITYGTVSTDTQVFELGMGGDNTLDKVALYATTLSAARVAAHYAAV